MLKGILKTLKSEKTNKGKQQAHSMTSKQVIESDSIDLLKQLKDYSIESDILDDEKIIVAARCKKIRYFVLEKLPPMMSRVMGCPISVFHLLPHSLRKVKEIDLCESPFPDYLDFMKPILEKEVPNYNHILINDYPCGIGIMPHSDGPAYLGKVVVLSLGSFAVINFQEGYSSAEEESQKSDKLMSQILLEPNSIHIFEGQAYDKYLHGINNMAIDSVLLNLDKESGTIISSNISNFMQLQVRPTLEKEVKKMAVSQAKQGLTEQHQLKIGNTNIRIVGIEGNSDYNTKIEFERRQRISVTIRHKFNEE